MPPNSDKNKTADCKHLLFAGIYVWRGETLTTEDYRHKLTALFSADTAGCSRLFGEDEG